MTICGSAAGSGSRCPRTGVCSKGSSSSSSGPARSGSPPSWRWRGRGCPSTSHPFTVASAAHGRARVRPPSGHDRPGQRGPADRPVARAPAADRPLHLLRGRDRGVDGGRAAARDRALRAARHRDADRAAGRHRLPPRGSARDSTAHDVDLDHGVVHVRAGQAEQAARGAAAPEHDRRAARLRPPA